MLFFQTKTTSNYVCAIEYNYDEHLKKKTF